MASVNILILHRKEDELLVTLRTGNVLQTLSGFTHMENTVKAVIHYFLRCFCCVQKQQSS